MKINSQKRNVKEAEKIIAEFNKPNVDKKI